MKRIENLNNLIIQETDDIEKLKNLTISKNISLWNYKQPEVVLLDEEYGSSFSATVELYNITEDVIKFLKPIAYVTSSNGWTDLGSLTNGSFTSYLKYDVFMEEENYAKIYMSGVTIALATGFIPIPIYWTVKLFFNPIVKTKTI